MGMTIDSRRVIDAILSRPDIFTVAKAAEIEEVARKVLVKQVKDRSLDVARFRSILGAIGDDSLSTILDGLPSKDLAGVVKKIDAHSPYAKLGPSEIETRAHIMAIGVGKREPAPQPAKSARPKAVRTPKAPSPKSGAILESKVHSGAKSREPKSKS